MKKMWILTALFLVISIESHAVWFPGIKTNIMLTCNAEDGSEPLHILSEKYTTKGYGELTEDPGALSSLVGRIHRSRDNVYSIQSSAPALPLKQIEQTGFFDEVLGIYQNKDYRLDLRSREQGEIILERLNDGRKIVCIVHGDCC